jgi:hypothetical protein
VPPVSRWRNKPQGKSSLESREREDKKFGLLASQLGTVDLKVRWRPLVLENCG